MDNDIDIALKDILSKTATDFNDKISILEARDKYLREKRHKQTDLATAVAVIGTCVDMCPEYERYFRQNTNQIQTFELDEFGNVDENRMVKEYRRSSADQDEPLPHELRAVDVLQRTMEYLCANVMDDNRSGDMCGKWYEFLWDRTRSIRKDIVQQHLCDVTSVSLIEKSARFYIHCAAVLCEEDLNNFDPKINEECLLNCIQSLKHYYHDLYLRDIYCANEAEIRAYDILIHLNDGGMRLRELKHCRTHVQNSDHILFAKSVFYSYQFNNYTKFFKLVKTGSYLFACVLHRYFIAMRVRAFNVICKAYTSSSSSMFEFSNSLLIDQLCFDSQTDLSKFCDIIGLQCDENSVYLYRGLIDKTSLKTQRSFVVENKRLCTVGETVNGEPLSFISIKQVHSSFDSNGKLIIDFMSFGNQNNSIKFSDIGSSFDNNTGFSVRRAIDSNSNAFKIQRPFVLENKSDITLVGNVNTEVLSDNSIYSFNSTIGPIILDDMIASLIVEILATTLDEEKEVNQNLNQITISLFSEIFFSVTNKLIVDFCGEVIRDEMEQKRKKDNKMREKQIIVETISSEINEDIICCEVDKQTKHLSEEVFQNSYQELIETQSELVFHDLIDIAVEYIVEDVAQCVYNNASNEREMLIELIQQKRYLRIEEKYFNKWRNWFLKIKRYQRYKESFPAAPNWGSSSTQMASNEHRYSDSLSIIDSKIEKANKNINIALKANNILGKAHCKRFNLIAICENSLCMSCENTPQVDYKLAIYSEDQSICEWINAMFFDSKPLPWFPTVKTEIYKSLNVNICVKGFFGYNSQVFSQKNNAIFGVHGMMLFVTRDHLKNTIVNTFQLLRQKPNVPSLPLMIVFFENVPKTDESLLKDKVDEIIRQIVVNQNTGHLTTDTDLISDISITFVNRFALDLHLKIAYSLIWLSKSRPNFAESKLTKRFLRELIESTIKQYFDVIESLKGVKLSIKKLPQFCKCFNGTLDTLSNILTSPQLQQISYPPKELNQELNQDWNSEHKINHIKSLLMDLHLPETETDLSDLDDEYIVWSFADIITKQCIVDSVQKSIDPTLFNAQINKALLARNYNSNNFFIEILKACIYFILDFNFPTENDFIVCCFKDDLFNSYTSLPSCWRLLYSSDTSISKRRHSLSSPYSSLFDEEDTVKRKRVNDSKENSQLSSHSSYDNIRSLFNDELTQSKALTKRLSDALDEPNSEELMSQLLVFDDKINDQNSVINDEVVIDDDAEELSQCVNLNESTTEKLDRLKRLIARERDVNQQFIGTVNTFISVLNLSENESLDH